MTAGLLLTYFFLAEVPGEIVTDDFDADILACVLGAAIAHILSLEMKEFAVFDMLLRLSRF